MQIESLLTIGRTCCDVDASGKRGALEKLAAIIAADIPALDADDLLRRFLARERLGSTGIGHGIAIPHCRVSNSDAAIGALITLSQPISYESIDDEPVDILFAMLVPDDAHDEHLKNLAALAGALNNSAFRQHLRDAKDSNTLYEAAVGSQT
ncbi:MAG: PTS fructose transporter subunit IIA [Moraxellaceae bacterium]|nr:MAG: PTS fructose transporter subunit IIA [Moraxellaceae bacterium]